MMDEFALIEKFFARRAGARDDVRLGIGDDAAVTRVEPGFDLVIATDTINEGTHFPPGTSAHALGHRCLAVNLSDLAAMGAEPLWCTLALSIPSGSADWVDAFASGFMALADAHEIALVGGDTVRGPTSINVTVHGRVPADTAIRRDGVRAGDGIYVTGRFGCAAAGLAMLSGAATAAEQERSELVNRFLYPAPRVREGRALVGIASAMIDVSDGLHVDLSRMLHASGVGAMLDVEALQLPVESVDRFGRARALGFALTGGDDYELCFAVPPDREPELDRVTSGWECGVARIGRAGRDREVRWLDHGRVRSIDEPGFRHFVTADL